MGIPGFEIVHPDLVNYYVNHRMSVRIVAITAFTVVGISIGLGAEDVTNDNFIMTSCNNSIIAIMVDFVDYPHLCYC